MNDTNAPLLTGANPLPYRLSAGMGKDFYSTLNALTSDVLAEGTDRLGILISNYQHSAASHRDEMQTSSDETILDLLMLGVLWNEYNGMWGSFLKIQKPILRGLFKLRKTNDTLKDLADGLRARLASKWLIPKAVKPKPLHTRHMQALVNWLSATGDFNEEVLRMKLWVRFLKTLPADVAQSWLNDIVSFASWFKANAYSPLHPFTSNVNSFLKYHQLNYRGREDYFFCGRREVEYHLNMVGAQIMNRSLKRAFQHAHNQVLLVPTCMAASKHCQAKELNGALRCMHCSVHCNISKTATQMLARGVETVLIKHSSNFSKWLEPWANQTHTGLIGTACVLNLLTGGFEMKRLNIPSQCIFLDACSCKKHWHPQGIPTSIDTKQVIEILKKDSNKLKAQLN